MLVDCVGQKFGLLTVVNRASERASNGGVSFICDCECGKRGHIVRSDNLKKARSCGCLRQSRRGEVLTQTRLKELLHYNPETGVFVWRVTRPGPATSSGSAGATNDKGYWHISVDGRVYKAHRLAWLYCYGQFPNGRLDHKDRNSLNNRIANLREATPNQNNVNSKTQRTSRTGLKGVGQRDSRRWVTRVQHNGNRFYIGTFNNVEEAYIARYISAKSLHGEFFHDGRAS